MEYNILGRTGLKVSVAGLGCGGPSRLGLRDNTIDTAESYGTEPVIGKAIAGVAREDLIISTKKTLPPADHPNPAAEIRRGLEQSLKLLNTEYIDIYHLHGVEPNDYLFAKERLMPPLVKLRDQGKIRFTGITEAFVPDPAHRMLERGLREDLWDVIMVGFNLLNPSARKRVLPLTRKKRIGVLNMFAVRRALSQPERLKTLCGELVKKRVIRADVLDADDPLGFMLRESGATTLPEAAYRFCRHEPGVDVVLTGTGNPEHLRANVASILKPPLPEAVLTRLEALFGSVDWLTGN
jgi:aryl-alcohol dehydrogenase-like predicted oxidoreductase